MSVIVLPLGRTEADRGRIEARLVERFAAGRVDWLDRSALRRRPARVLARLLARQYDHAVLVAPDLANPRVQLTSLLLALPRARHRWRLDLAAQPEPSFEPFRPKNHLRTSGPAIARHLLACGLALALAYPLLTLFERYLDWEQEQQRRRVPLGRPRRVLYLRSQLWLGLTGGGSVAHTAGVIGGLQQAGVEVQAVASDDLPGVRAPTCVVRPACWFDGLGREAEELVFNVPFGLAGLRAARRGRPDLVYQRHTAFNCTGALLSRLLGLPLALEFNSSEVWKGRHWGGLRLLGLARLVERINLRAADLVVVVSDALRDDLLRQGHVDGRAPGVDQRGSGVDRRGSGAKVLVNPNGVDPDRFRPDLAGSRMRARLGLASTTVIGFSGTFGVWHGVPTLAAALPRVLAARPQARWLLIGDGPLRGLVEQPVRDLRLQDRVALPGLVPHAEMPDYLAACDVLVSPHGRQVDGGEFFGSPTKLYEYMAAGRPIVASAVGQIAAALADGESALLVPPDDPDALTAAILRLVDQAGLRARLAAAARQQAERHHTWRHNAERLLRALEDAGAQSPPSPPPRAAQLLRGLFLPQPPLARSRTWRLRLPEALPVPFSTWGPRLAAALPTPFRMWGLRRPEDRPAWSRPRRAMDNGSGGQAE